MPLPSEPMTSFFGRERDVELVVSMLRTGGVVTLTGAPGIGKTRLAMRATAKRVNVVACDVSKARDLADVEHAVAAALEIEPARREDPTAVPSRLRALADACVVIDHADHVAMHVADAIRRWRDSGACFVVTSRTRLGVPDEHVHEVAPLPAADACALFADRARLARRDFDGRAEAGDVAAIVRKLDGIPLAIELAAARMAVMSASTLLSKLDDALSVLDRSDRERTLEGAIAAMCSMLSTDERRALARLAVVQGTFDVEMASALVGSAADVVETLLERSVVRAVSRGRFALYEIVRQFALGRIASDADRAEAERLLDAWLAARAERSTEDLGNAWLARLAEEAEDLRAAYERRAALPVALAWHSLLHARGELTRAREVLDAALEAHGAGDTRLVALALAWRVLHQRAQTTPLDAARARAECKRARALAEKAGDARVAALSVCALAYVAVQTGDDAGIERLLPEAIEMQSACGDAEGEMRTRRLAGTILVNQGREAEAMRHFERARDIARRVDPKSIAVYSAMIGCVHLSAGRLEEAERSLRDAVERIGVDAHLEGAQFAAYQAVALQELGRFEEADALYRRAIDTSRRQGDTRQLPITLHYWGTLAHETGDHAAAIERYRDALAHYAGGTREIATCTHAALAAALAAAGRSPDAQAEIANALHACRDLGLVWRTVAHVHAKNVALDREAPEIAASNEDVRFALRLLARRLADASVELVIGAGAAWFRVRAQPRVSLDRRNVLRALLQALSTHSPMTSDALIAALWPGETLERRTALNRLHVAIAQLRALGFAEFIVQSEGVYTLRGFRLEDG